MTQVLLNPVVSKNKQRILCSYSNTTRHPQIVRIPDNSSWFERVVFPGEWLLFEALPEASLENHSTMTPSTILGDKISCSQLEISLASYWLNVFGRGHHRLGES